VYHSGFEVRMVSGGEFYMDGKKVQLSSSGGGQRGPLEIRSISSRGPQTVGGRAHETLVAEGHYRCAHCRRADLQERTVTRMR
jgi:hypothetical protein